jgi:hypothetical protein
MRIRELLHIEIQLPEPPPGGPELKLAAADFDIAHHGFSRRPPP